MKVLVDGCGCFPTGRHYPGIAHLIRIDASGLVEGFAPEADWVSCAIALIDVETTGRDPNTDRIVELGIAIGKDGVIIDRKSWLVNPGRPIPDEAREVHGISDDMVKDAPTFAAVAREIVDVLAGAIPGAYNAEFDRGFLLAELERAGVERSALPASLQKSVSWIDPLVWARELHKFEKGRSLGDVAARLGIALDTAHRATNDAEAALSVLYAFSRDVRVPKSYAGLTQEQRRLLRVQDLERADWRKRPPAS